MTTPHPQADLLRAIADGKQMQGRVPEDGCDWFDIYPDQAIGAIASDYSMDIRIKPDVAGAFSAGAALSTAAQPLTQDEQENQLCMHDTDPRFAAVVASAPAPADETPTLKAFVWEDVLADYTSGMMVAVAPTVEEARAALLKECYYIPEGDLNQQPKELDLSEAVGFVCWGGG